jgi:predicted transcriptional regulator
MVKLMDNRNYNITNKIFEVLNNVKGFDVAMSNPREGKIIVRHEGLNFIMNIEPIFNDNDEGRESEKKPFKEVVKTNSWIFR